MLNTFNTCALKPCSQCETICRIEQGKLTRYEDFEQVIRDMEGEDIE